MSRGKEGIGKRTGRQVRQGCHSTTSITSLLISTACPTCELGPSSAYSPSSPSPSLPLSSSSRSLSLLNRPPPNSFIPSLTCSRPSVVRASSTITLGTMSISYAPFSTCVSQDAFQGMRFKATKADVDLNPPCHSAACCVPLRRPLGSHPPSSNHLSLYPPTRLSSLFLGNRTSLQSPRRYSPSSSARSR
jgi:hypothetical protein